MGRARSAPALVALVCLLASAEGRQRYTTSLEKSRCSARGPLRLASFAIPAGQCSGYIDQSLLCGALYPESVRVLVRDEAPFAAVAVADSLRSATVLRTRCRRQADVDLAVRCGSRPPPADPHAEPDAEPDADPSGELEVEPPAEPGRRRRALRLPPAA